MRYIRTLGFSVYSAKIRAKAQKMHKWLILYLMIATISANDAFAMVPCHGRFVNPITDICWSCILPISIGSISTGKSLIPNSSQTIDFIRSKLSLILLCMLSAIIGHVSLKKLLIFSLNSLPVLKN